MAESPFHAVRLRTSAPKRYKRTDNAEAIIWKLLMLAERTFRKLDAPQLLPSVAAGDVYVNGIKSKKNGSLITFPHLLTRPRHVAPQAQSALVERGDLHRLPRRAKMPGAPCVTLAALHKCIHKCMRGNG